MRRIHCLTLAITFLALAAAVPAGADTPIPPINATIPDHVVLVGRGPAGPDSAIGHVTVTIRDFANNPIEGSHVIFDFLACTDMAPAADQRDPRLSVDCSWPHVTAVTDANGIARLTVLGAGASGPATPPGAFKVYADGVLLGFPRLSVLERDGVNGLTLADLGFWAADLFSDLHPMRSDFDGNGFVGLADLSIWAAAYFNGGNTVPIGAVCP